MHLNPTPSRQSHRRWSVLIALLMLLGCSSLNDGTTSSASPPASINLQVATELARLNLYAYQQLNDHLANQTFTLPEPYQLQAQVLTFEEFAGERMIDSEAVPIAFVATTNDAIYIVFRGTKTISEWISDVTYPQLAYPFLVNSGLTHQGITTLNQTVHDTLSAVVTALLDSSDYTTLYVTGHSLGGAMAVLAAPALRDHTMLEPIMYNFASPRVGDPAFQQRYETEVRTSWRIVNANDLIPTLPPPLAPYIDDSTLREFRYQHVPNEQTIAFGSPINRLSDVLRIGSNHDMCNYYNTLCDQIDDPDICKAQAAGADDCNP